MRLKSLEIQGFKTFPDKTKLSFEQGITSVVGPNGSGKSNISDAIRWVLGEQSPKSLRCAKMEDVVFNGTDKRKRQGYAEVTLNIDNKDRALDFNGDDIAVTRRYYRSGESEYLINKAAVRLKDINELFMDTGLGRDGYSMIGQGKIDSIFSSKGEDRREIFELFQTAFQEDLLFPQVRLQYHEVLKGCPPYFSAFSQRQFFCICNGKYPRLLQKFLVCPHLLKSSLKKLKNFLNIRKKKEVLKLHSGF